MHVCSSEGRFALAFTPATVSMNNQLRRPTTNGAGHHGRRGQRPDTGNLLQSSTRVAGPMPGLDLRLDLLDLPVQQLQVLDQSIDQQTERSRQLDRGILDEARHTLRDAMPCGTIGPYSPRRPRI